MRVFTACFFIFFFTSSLFSEDLNVQQEHWSTFSGFTEELSAESLELRDELIAAQLEYFSALNKAKIQALSTPNDDKNYNLIWARVEYLVETCYRLLPETSNYQEFLDITSDLTYSSTSSPLTSLSINDTDLTSNINEIDLDELIYEDLSTHTQYLAVLLNGIPTLVDRDTAEPFYNTKNIVAYNNEKLSSSNSSIKELLFARVAWLRALILEKQNNIIEAKKSINSLGIIKDWLILGSFPNELNDGFDSVLDPEKNLNNLDSKAKYSGKDQEIWWRAHHSLDSLGRLFLDTLFQDNSNSLGYSLCLVSSDKSQAATLKIGTNGFCKIWFNSLEVSRYKAAGTAAPDQISVNVWLRKGWNVLLIKSTSYNHHWQLIARITDPTGKPLPLHVAKAEEHDIDAILTTSSVVISNSFLDKYYLPVNSDIVSTLNNRSDVLENITQDLSNYGSIIALSDHIKENPFDSRSSYYLGTLINLQRLMSDIDKYNIELIFRRALENYNEHPIFLLGAIKSMRTSYQTTNQEESLTRLLLNEAASKEIIAAYIELGRIHLEQMHQPRRAREYVRKALSKNPSSLRAKLLDYDSLVSQGWQALSEHSLSNLVASNPESIAVKLRKANSLFRQNIYSKALSEFYSLLNTDATNTNLILNIATCLRKLGQTSVAIDLLEKQYANFPYDFKLAFCLADLYQRTDKQEKELNLLNNLLTITPQNSLLLEKINSSLSVISLESSSKNNSDNFYSIAAKSFYPIDFTTPKDLPSEEWEYLLFHIGDTLKKDNSLTRDLHIIFRAYSNQVAKKLRTYSVPINTDLEKVSLVSVKYHYPDGRTENLHPKLSFSYNSLTFSLPPISLSCVVEISITLNRLSLPYLGDYFGHSVSFKQIVPVRLSRYTLTSPVDKNLYFNYENGTPSPLVISSENNEWLTRVWELSNLPGFTNKPFSPGIAFNSPTLQISSLKDWQEFSNWYIKTLDLQYNYLPLEFNILTKDLEWYKEDQLSFLTNSSYLIADYFVERKTLSGPDAFKPINPRVILARKSADSRERALLLCLLASKANIKSSPVLAYLHNPYSPSPFPSRLKLPILDYFNYYLTAANIDDSFLILDSSSIYKDPSSLPVELINAQALNTLTQEVFTFSNPGITACDIDEVAEMHIDEDGSILWEQRIKATGLPAFRLRKLLSELNDNRDANWLSILAKIRADVSTTHFDIVELPNEDSVLLTARTRLRNYSTNDGKRYMIKVPPSPIIILNNDNSFLYSLNEASDYGLRSRDIILPYAFQLSRSVSINYPNNWQLLTNFSNKSINTDFASFTAKVYLQPYRINYDFIFSLTDLSLPSTSAPLLHQLSAENRYWQNMTIILEKQ